MSPSDRSTLLSIAENNQTLLDNGYKPEDIAKMSLDDRANKAETYRINPETMAISALASVGAFFTGALAFVGLGGSTSGTTPTANGAPIAQVVTRRREDGEDDTNITRTDADAEEIPFRVLDTTPTDTGSAGGFSFVEQVGLFFGGVSTTNPIESNVREGEVTPDKSPLSIKGAENVQLANEYYLKYKDGKLSEAQFKYILDSMNSPTFNRENFTSTIDDKLNKLKFDGRTRPDTSGILQGLPMEHTGFPLAMETSPNGDKGFKSAVFSGDTFYVKFPEGDSRFMLPADFSQHIPNAPHYDNPDNPEKHDLNPHSIDVKGSSRFNYMFGFENQPITVTGIRESKAGGTEISFKFKDANGNMKEGKSFHIQYINDRIKNANPTNPVILRPGEPFGVAGPIGTQQYPSPGPHPHINFPTNMSREQFLEAMRKKWK